LPRKILEEILDSILKIITGRFKVDLVLLHGSYAKGTYIEDLSDIDLVVVSDDFEGVPIGERLSILAELLAGLEKPVEAIAYTKREFIENMRSFNPLILDALEYGIPLFKTDFYDYALKEFRSLKEKHGLKPIKDGWEWMEN